MWSCALIFVLISSIFLNLTLKINFHFKNYKKMLHKARSGEYGRCCTCEALYFIKYISLKKILRVASYFFLSFRDSSRHHCIMWVAEMCTHTALHFNFKINDHLYVSSIERDVGKCLTRQGLLLTGYCSYVSLF